MVFTFYYKITHNYAIVFRLPTAEINSMVRAFGISNEDDIRSTFMPLRRKKTAVSGCFLSVVRMERLELSHLAAPEPKSGASTNFATSAFRVKARIIRFCGRIASGFWRRNGV
jgi:hypothetical protein